VQPILLDAGFIVALLDGRDRAHRKCTEVFDSMDRALITCEPVITEATHLLRYCPGAAVELLRNIEAQIIELPWQIRGNEARLNILFEKYGDQDIDLADACLVLMAENFGVGDILTLDSDFAHYRWARNKSFHLWPKI
jgi:uncharacterized protein